MVIDVSPYCDCHAENDAPIVPDIGMFASFDPVALDIACADAVNQMPISPIYARNDDKDHFHAVHPTTNWRSGMEYAEKLGIGTQEYHLIKI